MARTHGTRSAYNAGCRCDDCREATRVARARQRAAQSWGPSALVPGNTDTGVAPRPAPGVGVALVGLIALGSGGYALWHGATLEVPEDTDSEALGHSRRRWLFAGTVLVVTGILVLAWVASAGAEAS